MNVTRKDLKRAIKYWATNSYHVWKELNKVKAQNKELIKEIKELKNAKA